MPKTLFGFDIVSRIGQGAASTIYAATDASGQLFALKHVVRKSEADDRFLVQLQNEQDVSRQFRHPCLRKVIELKIPRRFFSSKIDEAVLVMEWVDGTPLDEHVPPDLLSLLGIFAQCAAALASLHRLLLVHCDFKPHNVLVCENAKVKLIDFGQTCKTGTDKIRIQGTPDYITPEQVKCMPVDAKTDVYCLGASMYWCMTGRKVPTYFQADKARREMVKQQNFPSPRELKPEIPQETSDLVMHCLRYIPDSRPDMLSVLTTLEGLIRAAAPAAPEPVPGAVVPVHKKPAPRVVKDWGI